MTDEQELEISSGGGKYLSGKIAKAKGITKIKIVEPKPTMVEFTDDSTGKTSRKVMANVTYTGIEAGDPTLWTMNQTSARIIADALGTKLPSEWVGKVIPIEVSKTGVGYAILADEMLIAGTNPKPADNKQEEL